MSIWY